MQQSGRLSQIVPTLQAACRGRRGLMKAIDISVIVRRDMKPPVHPVWLAWINLNLDSENSLASRVAPDFLQRNALELGLRDKRLHPAFRGRRSLRMCFEMVERRPTSEVPAAR
jgi:hypothetical protein